MASLEMTVSHHKSTDKTTFVKNTKDAFIFLVSHGVVKYDAAVMINRVKSISGSIYRIGDTETIEIKRLDRVPASTGTILA